MILAEMEFIGVPEVVTALFLFMLWVMGDKDDA